MTTTNVMDRALRLSAAIDNSVNKLRHVVALLEGCNMDAVAFAVGRELHPRDLIRLHDAYIASGWDMYPDMWSIEQLRDAMRGADPLVPSWHEDETPASGRPFTLAELTLV